MKLTDKVIIGEEVSASAKVENQTGTTLDLSNNVSGLSYNYGSPSNAATFSIGQKAVNGFARCFINAPSEPTVTGATKISGADFVADTLMEMVVESPDGVNVEYYFLAR